MRRACLKSRITPSIYLRRERNARIISNVTSSNSSNLNRKKRRSLESRTGRNVYF
jgi:hypothetical protein